VTEKLSWSFAPYPTSFFVLPQRTKQEKARQNNPSPLCRKAGISNEVITAPFNQNYIQKLNSCLNGSAKAKALHKKFQAFRHSQASSPSRFVPAIPRCFELSPA
jgi:hypothetical protein